MNAAYLAGFMDGEGTFSVYKRGEWYTPVIRTWNACRETIEKIQHYLSTVGIKSGMYHRTKTGNRKDSWELQVQGKSQCEEFIRLVEPHLVTKAKVAGLVYQACYQRPVSLGLVTAVRDCNSRGK